MQLLLNKSFVGRKLYSTLKKDVLENFLDYQFNLAILFGLLFEFGAFPYRINKYHLERMVSHGSSSRKQREV